jgi:hypothetical protein
LTDLVVGFEHGRRDLIQHGVVDPNP